MSESAAAKPRKDAIVSCFEGICPFFQGKGISICAPSDVKPDASSVTTVMTGDNQSLHSRPHIMPFC